jgi:alkylation response protein AidB-like acyl-CoA dehydrogenase
VALAGLPIDEREMILDLVTKIRDRMLTPERIRELDETEEFPLDIVKKLLSPEIGLQLLFIPEEYGGLGGGSRDVAAVCEELAKTCLGVSTAFFAMHLGTDPILVGATEEQKQKWLTKVADGDALVAYAVTEPEAGSNLQNLKTTATPVTDESGSVVAYRLNGNKQFISNGGYADIITVLAQTPEGPSFFIAEKDMEGFKPGKAEVKHGIRCSNTAPLTFENVLVPAENLIGGIPGRGLHQANEVFGYTRLMVAAFGLGGGVSALEKAIAYAKERIQFGSPLIEKQGYTHTLILPHLVRLEAARAYIEEIAERLDSGEKDLQVEGAVAKYFATEAADACANDAIQALGGYGYITEYEVEKIKRDVKITTIYEGTSQVLQLVMATFRWRSTVKSKGEFYESVAREMDGIHAKSPDIGAALMADAVRALNSIIFAVHRAKLIRSQFVMFELADILAHVEVGAALMRKVQRLIESDAKTVDKMELISRLFVAEVGARASLKLSRIVHGTDVFDDAKKEELAGAIALDVTQYQRGAIADMDQLLSYVA